MSSPPTTSTRAATSTAPATTRVLAEDTPGVPTAAKTQTRWYLADHDGSVRKVLDDNGKFVRKLDYDAFGKVLSNTGLGQAPRHQYTGQRFDPDTGLSFYGARWYDPKPGRFVNQDPIHEGTNPYAYVGNDPLNYTDPTGLSASVVGISGGTDAFDSPLVDYTWAGPVFSWDRWLGPIGATASTQPTVSPEDHPYKQFLPPVADDGVPRFNIGEFITHVRTEDDFVPAVALINAGRQLAPDVEIVVGNAPSEFAAYVEHGRYLESQPKSRHLAPGYYDEFGRHYSFCLSCHSPDPGSALKFQAAYNQSQASWTRFFLVDVLPSVTPIGKVGPVRGATQMSRVRSLQSLPKFADEQAGAAQAAIRQRVLANIAESQASRRASRFDSWAFTYDSRFDSGNAASVAFQMRLPKSMYPNTAPRYHFREANRVLVEAMDADATFATQMNQLIPQIRDQLVLPRSISRKPPRGWTWHHSAEEGVMELVPSRQQLGAAMAAVTSRE